MFKIMLRFFLCFWIVVLGTATINVLFFNGEILMEAMFFVELFVTTPVLMMLFYETKRRKRKQLQEMPTAIDMIGPGVFLTIISVLLSLPLLALLPPLFYYMFFLFVYFLFIAVEYRKNRKTWKGRRAHSEKVLKDAKLNPKIEAHRKKTRESQNKPSNPSTSNQKKNVQHSLLQKDVLENERDTIYTENQVKLEQEESQRQEREYDRQQERQQLLWNIEQAERNLQDAQNADFPDVHTYEQELRDAERDLSDFETRW